MACVHWAMWSEPEDLLAEHLGLRFPSLRLARHSRLSQVRRGALAATGTPPCSAVEPRVVSKQAAEASQHVGCETVPAPLGKVHQIDVRVPIGAVEPGARIDDE